MPECGVAELFLSVVKGYWLGPVKAICDLLTTVQRSAVAHEWDLQELLPDMTSPLSEKHELRLLLLVKSD